MFELKFAYIDTETTGKNPEIHGIHQLSLIIDKVDIRGNVTNCEKINFNICPDESLQYDDEALAVSGRTIEEIKSGISERDFYDQFMKIISKYENKYDKRDKIYFVGYNVRFDADMLNALFKRMNDNYMYALFWYPLIDVALLSLFKIARMRSLMPDYKLMTVAKYCEIEIDESKFHDAMYDIEITREIFYKLGYHELMTCVVGTREKSVPTKLLESNVPSQTEIPQKDIYSLNYIMPFGKYRDKTIKDILLENASYLKWLHDNSIRGIKFKDDILEEIDKNMKIQENKSEELKSKSDYRNYEPKDEPQQDDNLPF